MLKLLLTFFVRIRITNCIILYRSLKLLRRNEGQAVTLLRAVMRYVVCVFRFVEVNACVNALVVVPRPDLHVV